MGRKNIPLGLLEIRMLPEVMPYHSSDFFKGKRTCLFILVIHKTFVRKEIIWANDNH